MNKSFKLSIFALSLCALLPVHAVADVHNDQRTSTFDITTGSYDFSSVSNFYSIYAVSHADATGDSETGPLTVKSGGTGLNITTTGGETTTYNPVAGTLTQAFNGSNLSGTTTVSYTSGATGFGSSFLQTGVSNGLHTLEFQGGGFGFLDNGNTFYLDVNINGNWTSMGNHTGQMQILGYDTAWSTPQVTFNGTTTNILLVDHNYNSTTDPNPNLDFKLYGSAAPTPTPASWLTFASAMGAFGLIQRKRKKASA